MRPGSARSFPAPLRALLLIPLLSLCAVLPLLLHGPSCGHDFDFHVRSWIDAGDQMRLGTLLPRWAGSAAWNAGEPRFVFYPPLSWTLGALLVLAFPADLVPAAFTWLALTGAGFAMYRLARRFARQGGSLLATAAYLANPYLLFTAFERTAYGELLAAVWMPLVLDAALANQLSPVALGLPLALLWLTNAPAGVMGCYAALFVLLCRIVVRWRTLRGGPIHFLHMERDFLLRAAGSFGLGLALPAFFLLPAVAERRFVQIAMAIIPNMRVEDNFLFGHTGDGPHDRVLRCASIVAMILLALTCTALLAARWRRGPQTNTSNPSVQIGQTFSSRSILALLAVAIAFMLTPLSRSIWHLVPEMAFLQFPWRLLAVLACVFAAGVAGVLGAVRLRLSLTALLTVLVVSSAAFLAAPRFRQGCEAGELPREQLALSQSHHGTPPTDEYTPITADNGPLRWDDPAWWLTADQNGPGPGTVPNPAETIEDYDQAPPVEQTVSQNAPRHLDVDLAQPKFLVLNLRDYPSWQVTRNGTPLSPVRRDDGLLAVALPAGHSTVQVQWHRQPDVWLGDAVSLLALLASAVIWRRSRRIDT